MQKMKWFFDIIYEWLEAKAYATEAWVTAKLYATEAWVLGKDYATETHVHVAILNLQDWIIAQEYLESGFVDRGDPAAEDFTDADLTEDGTWRDLDLSSIVPAGVTGVALTVRTRNAIIGKTLLLRKNGNVNAFSVSEQRIIIANIFHSMDSVVSVDPDRKIEYNADAPDNWIIRITVKGWWF